MKAMVLAAGLGTRLRPLTDSRPKALVELNGRTLLEITLGRLKAFGVRDVIVNVHHFADMVVAYLRKHSDFGLRIEISREDEVLLDTGGGLKKAAWFFLRDTTSASDPFLLHNVDVISDIDLAGMLAAHRQLRSLATLAVQERATSRYLLFDEHGDLCGRKGREAAPEIVRPTARPSQSLAFCGIHVISPRLLTMFENQGAFSIIDTYLNLTAKGEHISAFRADTSYWRDLGRVADLHQAEIDLKNGVAI